jgi:DNA helicase-2/ATP-dependent DNA helicase PcrA
LPSPRRSARTKSRRPTAPVPEAALLAGLNPEQHRAVTTTEGPLLVLAGAGTGKTRVITVRMAHLLARGAAPSSLLAMTFTNKAAREMHERVSGLVGSENGKQLVVGTFHSFCVRALREYPVSAGLPGGFSICDAGDQLSAARGALRELSVVDATLEPRKLLSRISLSKSRLETPEEALERAGGDVDELFARAWQKYEERLSRSRTLDFDDLLLRTLKMLRESDEVREAFRKRFRYVLVDEYQDTNAPQYEILTQLAGGHRNLCVVGDDDQSIYGWRGADVTKILNFERDFTEAAVVRLETNYRSTKQILRAANRVIANNPNRHEKELVSEFGDGEPVRFLETEDESDEATRIVREVLHQHHDKGLLLGDVAILLRTGVQARAFEVELRARALPYVLVGGPSFFDRKEVRDVLAYLRILSNPDDEVSFLRVVNCPPRGIGKTSIDRALAFASAEGITVMDAFRRGDEIEGLTTAAREAVAGFQRLLLTLGGDDPERELVPFVQRLIDATGYRAEVERQYPDPVEARSRWAAVEEVLNSAENHVRRSKQPSLQRFLEELTLSAEDSRDDDATKDRNALTLMTLHAAKGLEFPRVYLVGLEEGLLPHARAAAEGTIEEERRLMYVGITRAQRALTLSLARTRARYGNRAATSPSRFLFELRCEEPPATWVPAERMGSQGGGKKKAGKRRTKRAARR